MAASYKQHLLDQNYSVDLIRCAVLTSEKPVTMVGSWMHLAHPMAQLLCPAGYSQNHAFGDYRLLSAYHNPAMINCETLRSTFEALNGHPPNNKDALRVVLDRINSSLRRGIGVDSAIDLGIAIEGLMLHELQPDRGELRYRSAVRGAVFLGGDAGTRSKNFKLLREVYDLRSEAAHTGRFRERKKGERTPKEIMDESTRLVLSIARKVVTDRVFPNWDEHVLGAD